MSHQNTRHIYHLRGSRKREYLINFFLLKIREFIMKVDREKWDAYFISSKYIFFKQKTKMYKTFPSQRATIKRFYSNYLKLYQRPEFTYMYASKFKKLNFCDEICMINMQIQAASHNDIKSSVTVTYSCMRVGSLGGKYY